MAKAIADSESAHEIRLTQCTLRFDPIDPCGGRVGFVVSCPSMGTNPWARTAWARTDHPRLRPNRKRETSAKACYIHPIGVALLFHRYVGVIRIIRIDRSGKVGKSSHGHEPAMGTKPVMGTKTTTNTTPPIRTRIEQQTQRWIPHTIKKLFPREKLTNTHHTRAQTQPKVHGHEPKNQHNATTKHPITNPTTDSDST